MVAFKKVYNFRILAITIIELFLLSQMGYCRDLALRLPLISDGSERIDEALNKGSSKENPELRPIEELTWEDEPGVLEHFRVLCTQLRFPLPRKIIIDGNEVSTVIPRSLSIKGLRKLATDMSPSDYYKYLSPITSLHEKSYEAQEAFLKEFGIWQRAVFWYRYSSQIRDIVEYIRARPIDNPVKILVHATWNGEDAYGIAIVLDHLFNKGHSFEIDGRDMIEPMPGELSWLEAEIAAEFIGDSVSKYFTYKTPDVIALKQGFLNLVNLSQGDIRDPSSFGKDLDIVAANNVLGQGVFKEVDIIKSIQNVWGSLKPGGCFYMNNDSYKYKVLSQTVSNIMESFVFQGYFTKIKEGVWEKRGIIYKQSIRNITKQGHPGSDI